MSRELAIIEQIGRMTRHPEYLADDAFYEAETRRIYTSDLLVENHHFRLDYFTPEDLGWKAAAVNVSDIAAMGGRVKYLLVSLGLRDNNDLDWVTRFYTGMMAVLERWGGEIAGGDTVGSDQVVVNVTAVGECPLEHSLGRRDGARPGDYIVTTGYHGLSRVGLAVLSRGEAGFPAACRAHLRPEPRIEEGLLLSARFTRYALMDSSDGLADALLKMARASEVSITVDAAKIPVHPEVEGYAQAHNIDAQALILYGGEDFQLVAALPPDLVENHADLLAHVHIIGRVEAASAVPADAAACLRQRDGRLQSLSLEKAYQHFGESPDA